MSNQFVEELSKLRPSSTFLSLNAYRNNFSEIANYSIIFHINYKNVLERSIQELNNYSPTNSIEEKVCQSLFKSFKTSLDKNNYLPMEERQDGYQHFKNVDGEYIKGIKLHLKSDIIHLYGLINHKKILMPGIYPLNNETLFAETKRKLLRNLPAGKFRQFKITSQTVNSIAVENIKLLPPNN